MKQEQENKPATEQTASESETQKQLTFGEAIGFLKEGYIISRQGKGGNIFMQKGKIDYNSFDTIALKDVEGVPYHLFELETGATTSMPCIIIDRNGVLCIFTPNAEDILAEDWIKF